jgi:site-specific DNA-cytosine methylase
MSAALAIDLCCGLGGWAQALLAEGYDVIGFDIERHQYGEHRYPAQLVIQDIRTLHGSQFRDTTLMASAMIAKIPQPLARHIAATFLRAAA